MEISETDFFDTLTIQNDQISYVKHVLAPSYLVFTPFGFLGGPKGSRAQLAYAVFQPRQFKNGCPSPLFEVPCQRQSNFGGIVPSFATAAGIVSSESFGEFKGGEIFPWRNYPRRNVSGRTPPPLCALGAKSLIHLCAPLQINYDVSKHLEGCLIARIVDIACTRSSDAPWPALAPL